MDGEAPESRQEDALKEIAAAARYGVRHAHILLFALLMLMITPDV